jgi:hypothetical protein
MLIIQQQLQSFVCEMDKTAHHSTTSLEFLGNLMMDQPSDTTATSTLLYNTQNIFLIASYWNLWSNSVLTCWALYSLVFTDDIPANLMSHQLDAIISDISEYTDVQWLYCYALLHHSVIYLPIHHINTLHPVYPSICNWFSAVNTALPDHQWR